MLTRMERAVLAIVLYTGCVIGANGIQLNSRLYNGTSTVVSFPRDSVKGSNITGKYYNLTCSTEKVSIIKTAYISGDSPDVELLVFQPLEVESYECCLDVLGRRFYTNITASKYIQDRNDCDTTAEDKTCSGAVGGLTALVVLLVVSLVLTTGGLIIYLLLKNRISSAKRPGNRTQQSNVYVTETPPPESHPASPALEGEGPMPHSRESDDSGHYSSVGPAYAVLERPGTTGQKQQQEEEEEEGGGEMAAATYEEVPPRKGEEGISITLV